MTTGQPDTDSTATGPDPRSVPPPLPQATAVFLGTLSVVMIVGGGVIAATGPTLSALVPTGSVRMIPALIPPSPQVPSPTSSTRTPRPRPTGPDAFAALSTSDARAQLRRWAAADAEEVAALAGTWVPQVSSKCAGLKVDIGPRWRPDGRAETKSVTTAKIAAFHAALHARFGALTARPTTIGIENNNGTRGACAGRPVWISLVPQSFADPATANAWCDTNDVPVHECGARLVAPGDKSGFVGRD